MIFRFKVFKNGKRAVEAELHRDKVIYRSGWRELPDQGMGIDERRAAWADVITQARQASREAFVQVYSGEEK